MDSSYRMYQKERASDGGGSLLPVAKNFLGNVVNTYQMQENFELIQVINF